MKYVKSTRYDTPELNRKIMGPNPVKLEEELLQNHRIPAHGTVCDLGSGQGLTSVFLAKEYGFTVYATDLWSDPDENRRFFRRMGLSDGQVIPVKADATAMPFEREFFDAVVSTDSYNYFGRDPEYLDAKLAPFVKSGGYIYIAITGMKNDCHDALPEELLLSWTPEQLDYIHDADYWRGIVSRSTETELLELREMESNEEVWADWLRQEKYYALVKAKLTGPAAERFFDTGALCALLDAHRAGKTNAMTKLWAFYCFIEWYEVYFTGKIPPDL